MGEIRLNNQDVFEGQEVWKLPIMKRKITNTIGEETAINAMELVVVAPDRVINELIDLMVARCDRNGFEDVQLGIVQFPEMQWLDASVFDRLAMRCEKVKKFGVGDC